MYVYICIYVSYIYIFIYMYTKYWSVPAKVYFSFTVCCYTVLWDSVS